MKGSEHKLDQRKFHLNTRKHFTVRVTKHWSRLPKEAGESPSLQVFKSHLDTILSNVLQLTLPEQGGGTR